LLKLTQASTVLSVLVSKAWNSQLRGSIGKQKPSDPPSTLDYDLWVGPADDRLSLDALRQR
jgi:hypothetical protein